MTETTTRSFDRSKSRTIADTEIESVSISLVAKIESFIVEGHVDLGYVMDRLLHYVDIEFGNVEIE